MIPFALQTPTAGPTPTVLYRSQTLSLPDEEISQIEDLLAGLGGNSIGQYDKTHSLNRTMARLASLKSLEEGWNGYDVAAPNRDSIGRAHWWIRDMYRDTNFADNHTCAWMDPHVSANENGDVTFEWWNGDKKLTVYVSPLESWYIKVWGADVQDEMSDGSADSAEERQDIWVWLTK